MAGALIDAQARCHGAAHPGRACMPPDTATHPVGGHQAAAIGTPRHQRDQRGMRGLVLNASEVRGAEAHDGACKRHRE